MYPGTGGNSGAFGLNCGGNSEDIAVELAIEEMCAGCYCARPGMRRGLI